jgi:hypothetical protein
VDGLEKLRVQWENTLQEAYELFLPQMNPFARTSEGAKLGMEVLDSTPTKGLKRWASRKHQALLPPQRKFARLVAGQDAAPEQKDLINKLLERENDVLFSELNQSNFATASHESLQDAAIHEGALTVQDSGEEVRPLRFTAYRPSEVLHEDGPFGDVENVYRVDKKMRAELIQRRWPGFQLSATTQQQMVNKPNLEVELIEATVFSADRQVWEFMVIERTVKHLGWHEIIPDSPWIIYGASKRSDESYRRGPALDALPTARTLNRVQELILRNAALSIAGAWTAEDDDVIDQWNLVIKAGVVIPVGRHESLKPLEMNRDFDVAQFIVKDLQEEVLDMMEARTAIPLDDKVHSPTEIIKREQESLQDTISSSARMQGELVRPVIRKAVGVLQRRGRLEPRMQLNGREVEIDLEGPLARAQDQDEILRAVGFFDAAAPFGEAALGMAVKSEVIVKRIAEKSGLWPEAIRTEAEVADLQRKGAELAQQAFDQQQGGGAPAAPGQVAA